MFVGKNERMCLSKRVYWSKSMADQVAAKRTRAAGFKIRAYQCPNCGQWHLTKREG